MQEMVASFFHLTGGRRGARDVLPGVLPDQGGLIGRDASAAVVRVAPEDDGVSRRHARVGRDGAGWWIEPAGGTNGTSVDGQAILGRAPLTPGAVVGLGTAVTLRFDLHPAPAVSPRPASPQPHGPVVPLRADLRGLLLALGALLVGGFGASLFRRSEAGLEERARARLSALSDTLDRFAKEKEKRVDGDGRYLPSPEVVQAIEKARAAYAELSSLAPDQDPLTDHLQRVLAELSGDPSSTVSRLLRDEVAQATADLLREKPGAYCRSGVVRRGLVSILRDELRVHGDPPERAEWLSYIPWIESNYYPDPPVGGDGERGLWQFIPQTGIKYKLVLGERDNRCDVAAATRAAAAYFHDSFAECTAEYPLLAVAAFNTGTHNACRLARNEEIPKEERDHLGFIQRGLLHPVTHEYVPRWLASTFIGEHPDAALAVARTYSEQIAGLPTCTAGLLRVPDDGPCGPPRTRDRPDGQ